MWNFSKLRQISTNRQGITFQKPWLLLNTAVNTSSLAKSSKEFWYFMAVKINIVICEIITLYIPVRDYRCFGRTFWRSWLRHCATNRKVAGSSPDGLIGIHWHNPSGRTMASNRKEYQEYLRGGKGGQCVELTTLPHSCADCLAIWEPQLPGTLRACQGLKWDCFSILPFFILSPSSRINIFFQISGFQQHSDN